jgi:hypothetical protein
MTERFDQYIQILQENLELNLEGVQLTNSPSKIEIVPNSDAENFLKKPKNRSSNPYSAFVKAQRDWSTMRQRPSWSKLQSTRYSDKIKVPNINIVFALPGPSAPRMIGKIENDTFYVYWLGTHEAYNSTY